MRSQADIEDGFPVPPICCGVEMLPVCQDDGDGPAETGEFVCQLCGRTTGETE